MITKKTLKIGTRSSKLAIWQAEWVKHLITTKWKHLDVELVFIQTKGDKILDTPLAKIGGKGLFVKELEEALYSKKIDLAVHSMKDVPTKLPNDLEISIITKRENPKDALISNQYSSFKNLPQNAKIGTSSLRRIAQLKYHRPDLQFETLRGNVNTRLAKLDEMKYDAIILAVAGLIRLEMKERITEELNQNISLPAVAQGAIGIETRCHDSQTLNYLQHLEHKPTQFCIETERAFLKTLEGGCQVPIAGYATLKNEQITFTGIIAEPNGSLLLKEIDNDSIKNRINLGVRVAKKLLNKGGKKILQDLFTNK